MVDFAYFEFHRQAQPAALIEVWTQQRAPFAVPRRLYGKFTEHLGHNIYHGMWAQVLDNPGFEPGSRLAADERALAEQLAHFGRLSAPFDPAAGVAPYWEPVGSAQYSLVEDGVQGTAQRIRAQAAGGVRQAIFLPLHRTGAYSLSVWVRGQTSGRLRLTVQDAQGRPIGETEIGRIGKGWRRRHARLNVDQSAVPRGAPLLFSAVLSAPGTVDLDQLFVFPADHARGFDPDVVARLREARLPLLRYPGGNFVSGYHWRDGVGPVDARPTRPNPAWNVPEYNHVGTDEFMAFCRMVGCEPMICVNAGDGTPEEAAAWVEYCNGSPETKWGAVRARNGHRRPYGVRLWEVGNEIYGSWQIGHCSAPEYARRYAAFARAMRAVDPRIELVACGADQAWNAALLVQTEEPVRSISVHTLPGSHIPADADARVVWREVGAFPVAYYHELRGLAEQMGRAGRKPRLAITELQVFTNKRSLPNNSNLAEALFLAGVIHSAVRLGDVVELLTHSALVNHAGGLRKTREVVYPNPVHFTSLLYATTPGRWPLCVRVTGEGYDAPGQWLPAARDVPFLDALALADGRGRVVSLLVINRDPDRPLRSSIRLHGFSPRTLGVRVLTGPDFMAQNEWDRPDVVSLRALPDRPAPDPLEHEFPPHSVTELVFRAGSGP